MLLKVREHVSLPAKNVQRTGYLQWFVAGIVSQCFELIGKQPCVVNGCFVLCAIRPFNGVTVEESEQRNRFAGILKLSCHGLSNQSSEGPAEKMKGAFRLDLPNG